MTDGFNANHLAAEICKLQNRAEQAEDALTYWKERAETLEKLFKDVEHLVSGHDICINGFGDDESTGWEVSIEMVWADGQRTWRSAYEKSTLRDTLQAMVDGEKEAQP